MAILERYKFLVDYWRFSRNRNWIKDNSNEKMNKKKTNPFNHLNNQNHQMFQVFLTYPYQSICNSTTHCCRIWHFDFVLKSTNENSKCKWLLLYVRMCLRASLLNSIVLIITRLQTFANKPILLGLKLVFHIIDLLIEANREREHRVWQKQ